MILHSYQFWLGGGARFWWEGINAQFPQKYGGVSKKQKMCIKVGLNSYFVLYSVKYRKNLYHFVKELYVRRKNRVKCPNNFGIWGTGLHGGQGSDGPPPYWITLFLVSLPTIPVFTEKQTSLPQVTEFNISHNAMPWNYNSLTHFHNISFRLSCHSMLYNHCSEIVSLIVILIKTC